ncbi:exported hypothetical protein [Candidatus Sulfopaludibacter sp. SbA4]|nr:exported hypothetical protein [Candidatus Sulfopaludibacter sp. SbA4]
MTRSVVRNRTFLAAAIAGCVSLCQAQSGTTTRIEETDKSIAYSGVWYTNGSSLNSGGSAALTNAPGATAVVSFTGTGITWIGVLDPWSGLATVYLDGTLSTVDTYGPSTLYQQPLFKVSGLANGPHTLSIGVPHVRDANGLGSWVWIDAFDIQNGSGVPGGFTAGAGRTEQDSPAVTYTGTWLPNSSAANSGGSAVLATNAGSSATIGFSGTGITWIAYRDQSSGIAKVYVDGILMSTVDTYLSPAQAQVPTYTIDGLASGAHTLMIEVTGTHDSSSNESWVWVDAFDVVGSGSQAIPPSPTGVSPAAGNGLSQTFAVTFADSAGWQNLAVADVLINNGLDGRHACFVVFVPSGASSGSLFLLDDTGATGGPASAIPLPGSGSVSNSQCAVNAAGSSASWAGDTLTLTLAIAFNASFSGNKVLFLAAQGKSASSAGWQALGTWEVPGPVTAGPAVGGVSPARSNTLNQSYTFTYTDTNGGQDIAVANVLINSALDGRRACYLAFVPSGPAAGSVLLVDDGGDNGGPYQGMVIPGSGSIGNSQCSIAAAGSSVSLSGNTLALTLAITFSQGFAGNQIFFVAARSNTLNTNWQAVGTVTVP